MRTKTHNFYYYQGEHSYTPEIAFRTAFRRYKKDYLCTLKQTLLPRDPKGYEEFVQCPCIHPLRDEATGELAHILDLETSTRYPHHTPAARVKQELSEKYQIHHFVLRAVRKFYHSRLIDRNSVYNACRSANGNGEVHLQSQIPLTPKLRNELPQYKFPPTLEPFLRFDVLSVQYPDVRYHLQNPLAPALWPAQILEKNYFLEMANVQIPELDAQNQEDQIRGRVTEVAEDLDLPQKLIDYSQTLGIPNRQQQDIREHIIQNLEKQERIQKEQERIQETTASVATVTLDRIPEGDGSERFLASSSSAGGHPPFLGGSLAIYHGTGASPIFGISALLWGTYLAFKIYEFFVPQKETSTNIKDCLLKCAEHKISKEATLPVEATLTKF